jgi:hypothetical protein
MAGFEKWWTSKQSGIDYQWRNDGDGNYTILASQDLESTLDFCKDAYTHNDGYSPSRELRRAMFLPDIIVMKWLNEEGWYAYDPDCRDKLKQKMNDPDYLYLRTAPGRI